ncbi:Endoplasmic reticulum chaperone BiP [Psilocybe cubensis]|uniref:Endoplasmic reticulum chaperone BiP n=2 Tax=Psilocybe cubensis TaxID=181762 RepID=A0ACB8GID9_PSICU|nr:Endoplasmic reticulum chaperone BiP [Psilocybe cubensis]KAH9475157.1 Endoplasmic reticulum chaperone BiP [Psilocybe cubensis]
MSNLSRKNRYHNAKLVLCIDIGTTFTAASYCLVPPTDKETIKFQEINRWPKQNHPDAKVPSIIYYDKEGKPRLRGAEIEDEESKMEAEISDWRRAEWWKMLLRPSYFSLPEGFSAAALPPRVTVEKAFEDQMAYVMENVRRFINTMYPDGVDLWNTLHQSMVLVLTTPNGWDGLQQHKMREASVKSGLIKPEKRNYVRFVSEGEAAIHYCIDNTPKTLLKIGSTILVCDIGGGTIDLGVYKLDNLEPISLAEVGPPSCYLAGGVYVDYEAKIFIRDKLSGSKWGTNDDIDKAAQCFEKGVKRLFTGKEDSRFLNLNGSNASDESRGIVRGRLKMKRADLIKIFEPSIRVIRNALMEALTTSTSRIDQIFVVGGFADSPYVYSQIEEFFKGHKIPVCKPNDIMSKAISHGGLRWHFDSGVQVRIAKLHYGAETTVLYDPKDAEMVGRAKFQNCRGEWRVRNAWKTIVPKNTRIRGEDEHREIFHIEFEDPSDLEVELELFAYRLLEPPTFLRNKDGSLVEGIIHLGTVKGNLRRCYEFSKLKVSKAGKQYKILEYQICLYFGDTELKANLRWKENGKTVVGDAIISYDVHL